MENMFFSYLRAMKRYAVFQAYCLLSSMIITPLAIWILLAQPEKWYISFVLLIIVVACIILFKFYQYRVLPFLKQHQEPFSIPIHSEILQKIKDGEIGTEIEKNAFYLIEETRSGHIRELIQITNQFDSKMISRERKRLNQSINLKHSISGDMPRYANWIRMNVIFCYSSSDSAIRWVNENAQQMLRRNESIINVAIFEDSQKLVFPSIPCGIELNLLKSYETAFLFLNNQFSLFE